jgi:resuscitation-promoting factor RpfB
MQRPSPRREERVRRLRAFLGGDMPTSPARSDPVDAHAWLPIPDVDNLPALEELLDDDRLVRSGQTQAMTDTEPTPVVPPKPQPRTRARGRGPAPGRPAARLEPKPATRQPRIPQRARLRRRFLLIGLAFLTIAALAFAVLQLLPDSPGVTIRVDDKEHIRAETDAGTVRGALRELGVELGPEDRVSPGPATQITDGLTVDVFRPFPVVVDYEGEVRAVNTTWPTPSRLVRQLNVDPDTISIVHAPTRLSAGASVVLRALKGVTIAVDGTQHAETTAALDVSEFLQQNGVVLGLPDRVAPSADTRLTDGMTVTVTRIVTDTAQADEPLPPPTIRRDDPGLPTGQEQETQAGVAGVQRVTYQIMKENGQETARSAISSIPVQPPKPRVVAVGTALPNTRSGSASWYESLLGNDACAAKRYVPTGVIVRVTNLNTGRSATCRVKERVAGSAVIELDGDVFGLLASKDIGMFPVRIDW